MGCGASSPSSVLAKYEHREFVRFGENIYHGQLRHGQPDGEGLYTWADAAEWVKYEQDTTYQDVCRNPMALSCVVFTTP